MKVEHITLGGNAVIRDTDNISDAVIHRLGFISGQNQKIWIKDLPFGIKITVGEEGCLFNIEKNDQPAIMNICCFDSKYKGKMMSHLHQVNFFDFTIIDPVTPNWLYSVMINPFLLTNEELELAGEVELYIYHQIFNYK